MKILIIGLVILPIVCGAQTTVIGKWKTIDDSSGEERSIVELYERGGFVYGKVVKTFPKAGEDPDPICDECSPDDPRYKKKIISMEILQKMKKAGDEYSEGNILDPENGKIYRCKLWLENGDLKVRGYWGPFFRTQTWKRVP
jgi:uncharacterized protein (DUF2147 family)